MKLEQNGKCRNKKLNPGLLSPWKKKPKTFETEPAMNEVHDVACMLGTYFRIRF